MTYEGNCRLGELFSSRRENGREGLPTLSVTISDGLVNREDLDRKQDTNLAPEDHLLVRPGDIAYNMMRMWQGASGLASYEGMVSPAYVVLRAKNGIDPLYASYLFKTQRMLYLFWAYSYGLTEDRLRLYFQDFCRIQITIPPKPEQTRIATILTDWDSAIATAEKLLFKTSELKAQLAKHLLSGEIKLSGHTSSWETRTLGDVADVCMGSSPDSSTYNDKGNGLPLIQGNADIQDRVSSPKIFTSGVTRECFPGDILLSVRAPVGQVSRCIHHACLGRGMAAIRPEEGMSPAYLYQVLINSETKWAKLSQGSTFDAVTAKEVKKQKLRTPTYQKEQDDIAAVLGIADQKICRLTTDIQLLRAEKLSLMQQLIGGKRRAKAKAPIEGVSIA